jgi:hypothetical protein
VNPFTGQTGGAVSRNTLAIEEKVEVRIMGMDELINILIDKGASISDRDDAAMDLADFDDAVGTLIKVASDPLDSPMVLATCGTSIAEIWRRTNFFDEDIVNALANASREEILASFSN